MIFLRTGSACISLFRFIYQVGFWSFIYHLFCAFRMAAFRSIWIQKICLYLIFLSCPVCSRSTGVSETLQSSELRVGWRRSLSHLSRGLPWCHTSSHGMCGTGTLCLQYLQTTASLPVCHVFQCSFQHGLQHLTFLTDTWRNVCTVRLLCRVKKYERLVIPPTRIPHYPGGVPIRMFPLVKPPPELSWSGVKARSN